MNIAPARTPQAVTDAWRAFFDSLGVRFRDDGALSSNLKAWPHWHIADLGDGTLSVRWRIARAELHRPMVLSDELWHAAQHARDVDLVVIVDRPPALPALLDADPHRPGEPLREQPNAYTVHATRNTVTHGAYFWTDCPGCGGLAWRLHGWAGGCPKPEPDGDEFVYAHSSPRLLVAYLSAGAAVAATADTRGGGA